MPTISPAPLSVRNLSFAERGEIAILNAQGVAGREIARRLRRASSTVRWAAARRLLTHVYYGLRDGHIRASHPCRRHRWISAPRR